ncbi:hypothetical protein Efla_000745 [Eimeria flavescens]
MDEGYGQDNSSFSVRGGSVRREDCDCGASVGHLVKRTCLFEAPVIKSRNSCSVSQMSWQCSAFAGSGGGWSSGRPLPTIVHG